MYSQMNPTTLTKAAEKANQLYIEITISSDELSTWADAVENLVTIPLRQRAADLEVAEGVKDQCFDLSKEPTREIVFNCLNLLAEVFGGYRTVEDWLAWAEQLEKYLVLPLRKKANG